MYATGVQESYFISLYLLVIIVASILFSRRVDVSHRGDEPAAAGGDGRAGVYRQNCRARMWASPRRKACSIWIPEQFVWISGGRLSLQLADAVHCAAKARSWTNKREELQDLQAFNEDIIHSMRGGCMTTDLEGRMLLLNRTGEDITGIPI